METGEPVTVSITARPVDNLLAWTADLPGRNRRFRHLTWPSIMNGNRDVLRADPDRIPRVTATSSTRASERDDGDGKRSTREAERIPRAGPPNSFSGGAHASPFLADEPLRDAP